MTAVSANPHRTASAAEERGQVAPATLANAMVVLPMSYLALFLGMTRRPISFDEGLVLTGAMRVAAGQVPHRDFYTLYGPAQFYLIAGLFKVFGESLLVARLFDLLVKASIVTLVYWIASFYCSRRLAACTSLVTFLWLFAVNALTGTAVMPVLFLNLLGSFLILPIFLRRLSARRMFAVGCLAGLTTLFRYDTGMALLVIHAGVVAIAISLRTPGLINRLRATLSTFWPYLLGFAVLVLPPALCYVFVASLAPLEHDMVVYPARYYNAGRRLPFPGITLKSFENLAVYLPLAILGTALYVWLAHTFKSEPSRSTSREPMLRGFLITFAFLTLAMYFKGLVRVGVLQLFLATIPSLLLVAVLLASKETLVRPVRILICCLAGLSVLTVAWAALHEARLLQLEHSSVPEWALLSAKGSLPPTQVSWCNQKNPLTTGFCFLPDDDRMRTIEFIAAQTKPGQRLYEGVPHHDRIFAGDDLVYFAAQRIPATKWSELDPDLENRSDIQTQMVHELERNIPPYIVLDSEFHLVNEPNDSSLSSGVTLLDDYIHDKYKQRIDFGPMSVWKRTSNP